MTATRLWRPVLALVHALCICHALGLAEPYSNDMSEMQGVVGKWHAKTSKAWYVRPPSMKMATICHIVKGGIISVEGVVNQGFPNLRDSAGRFHCDGGDWMQIPVICVAKSPNSTSIRCPDALNAPNDIALWDWDQYVRSINFLKCMKYKVLLSLVLSFEDASSPAQLGQHFNDADWATWFENWNDNLVKLAIIGERPTSKVDMISIGSGMDIAQGREARWRKSISMVKAIYKSGKVVYGASKDTVQNVKFWDALDFVTVIPTIGLAAGKESPSLENLMEAWKPYIATMQALNEQYNKKILFHELGYRSGVGANQCPGCKTNYSTVDLDQKLQARLYTALFESWCNEWWFAGIFWSGLSQNFHRDLLEASSTTGYEFVNKPSETVLKEYFMGKSNCAPSMERALHCEEVTTWNGVWNTRLENQQ